MTTELHQALKAAIDALNTIPNSRVNVAMGDTLYVKTYDLLPALSHALTEAKKSELHTIKECDSIANALVKQLTAALEKAAWFIENVSDDTPNRTELFFQTREIWREALTAAEA